METMGAFYRHVNTRRFGGDHPFSGWLIRNALLLQQSFAAIFAQLRDTLWSADISQERMSYEASVNRVTTINEALARMAEIDPPLGHATCYYPSGILGSTSQAEVSASRVNSRNTTRKSKRAFQKRSSCILLPR